MLHLWLFVLGFFYFWPIATTPLLQAASWNSNIFFIARSSNWITIYVQSINTTYNLIKFSPHYSSIHQNLRSLWILQDLDPINRVSRVHCTKSQYKSSNLQAMSRTTSTRRRIYIEVKKVQARGCCLTAVDIEKHNRIVAGSQSMNDFSIQVYTFAQP